MAKRVREKSIQDTSFIEDIGEIAGQDERLKKTFRSKFGASAALNLKHFSGYKGYNIVTEAKYHRDAFIKCKRRSRFFQKSPAQGLFRN